MVSNEISSPQNDAVKKNKNTKEKIEGPVIILNLVLYAIYMYMFSHYCEELLVLDKC